MSGKIFLYHGHAIDSHRNTMALGVWRNLDSDQLPYTIEINKMPWTISLGDARRLARAARDVAHALEPRRDGRRPRERIYFSAEPPGPSGPFPIALGIEARGDGDIFFFTFGLCCVRFPAGEGDGLLNLFSILGGDVEDVQRATVAQQPPPAPNDSRYWRAKHSDGGWADRW
jgi:hypothetical protein